MRCGCPPDYQILWGGKLSENIYMNNFFISCWTSNTKLHVICSNKMRATKTIARATRFRILVVLRLPTFGLNFATLNAPRPLGSNLECLLSSFQPPKGVSWDGNYAPTEPASCFCLNVVSTAMSNQCRN